MKYIIAPFKVTERLLKVTNAEKIWQLSDMGSETQRL